MTQNICVLIDFENVERGTIQCGYGRFDAGLVLGELRKRGNVRIARAYADFTRYPEHAREMLRDGVASMQLSSSERGKLKNGADMALCVDALSFAYTSPWLDTFVIFSADVDFVPLLFRLKDLGKTVYFCGVEEITSTLLISCADEFISYGTLHRMAGRRRVSFEGEVPHDPRVRREEEERPRARREEEERPRARREEEERPRARRDEEERPRARRDEEERPRHRRDADGRRHRRDEEERPRPREEEEESRREEEPRREASSSPESAESKRAQQEDDRRQRRRRHRSRREDGSETESRDFHETEAPDWIQELPHTPPAPSPAQVEILPEGSNLLAAPVVEEAPPEAPAVPDISELDLSLDAGIQRVVIGLKEMAEFRAAPIKFQELWDHLREREAALTALPRGFWAFTEWAHAAVAQGAVTQIRSRRAGSGLRPNGPENDALSDPESEITPRSMPTPQAEPEVAPPVEVAPVEVAPVEVVAEAAPVEAAPEMAPLEIMLPEDVSAWIIDVLKKLVGDSAEAIYTSRLADQLKDENPKFRTKKYGFRTFGALLIELERQRRLKLHAHPVSGSPMVEPT